MWSIVLSKVHFRQLLLSTIFAPVFSIIIPSKSCFSGVNAHSPCSTVFGVAITPSMSRNIKQQQLTPAIFKLGVCALFEFSAFFIICRILIVSSSKSATTHSGKVSGQFKNSQANITFKLSSFAIWYSILAPFDCPQSLCR